MKQRFDLISQPIFQACRSCVLLNSVSFYTLRFIEVERYFLLADQVISNFDAKKFNSLNYFSNLRFILVLLACIFKALGLTTSNL